MSGCETGEVESMVGVGISSRGAYARESWAETLGFGGQAIRVPDQGIGSGCKRMFGVWPTTPRCCVRHVVLNLTLRNGLSRWFVPD